MLCESTAINNMINWMWSVVGWIFLRTSSLLEGQLTEPDMLRSGLLLFALAVCCSQGAKFSKEEEDCFSKGRLYHEPTNKCHEILSKGPCKEGEWFVLSVPEGNKITVKGVCKKDLCSDSTGIYWAQESKCVGPKDKERLCGSDREVVLTTNDFGFGECSCTKSPPHARINDDPKQKCQKLYSKGSCASGEVIGIPPELGVPKCIKDPCHEQSLRMKIEGTLPRTSDLAMFNGTCYELGKPGPCPHPMVFKVGSEMYQPGCFQLTNSVFTFGKYEECEKSENGKCVEGIRVQVQTFSSEEFKRRKYAALAYYRKYKKNKAAFNE